MEAFVNIAGLAPLRSLFFRFGLDLINNQDLLEEIAQYAMFSIKKRTLAGKDVNEENFIPYSPRYMLIRASAGRPINKVDLFFTGSMQASMTSDITGNSVRLYFLNTKDRTGTSNPLKAFFLNEDRNFFALSENDVQEIINIVEEYIRNLIS